MNCPPATLAILAGGRGSRMGLSKTALLINHRPILTHLLDRVAWGGPTLLVTAADRPHPPGSERFTREVHDPVPSQGPVRGLLTALEAAATDIVVCIPVDMPFLGAAHLEHVASLLLGYPQALAVMLMRPAAPPEPSRLLEPFPLAARTALAPVLRHHLASARPSLRGLAACPLVVTLPAPADWPAATWTNLNTPADVRGVAELHASMAPPGDLAAG